jgi:hypothetical protein
MEHPTAKVIPKVFMDSLPGPWQMATRKDIILKGFRETGIIPLNPSIVLDNEENFVLRLCLVKSNRTLDSYS